MSICCYGMHANGEHSKDCPSRPGASATSTSPCSASPNAAPDKAGWHYSGPRHYVFADESKRILGRVSSGAFDEYRAVYADTVLGDYLDVEGARLAVERAHAARAAPGEGACR